MGFTQPCFIRKNIPELRKKLEELGYENVGETEYFGKSDYTYCGYKICFVSPYKIKKVYNNFIDCGTNEELFLALAALRDDSDYMQWFICDDNESMFKVDKPDMSMSKFIHEYMDGWDVSGARKATVEELIEHFKDK